jgi:hypothetical protein
LDLGSLTNQESNLLTNKKEENKPKHISSHLLGEKQMLDYHLQEDNK